MLLDLVFFCQISSWDGNVVRQMHLGGLVDSFVHGIKLLMNFPLTQLIQVLCWKVQALNWGFQFEF